MNYSNLDLETRIYDSAWKFLLIILAVCIFLIVCKWKLYTKMNTKGVYSIIPLYNDYTLCKCVMTDRNAGMFFIFNCLPTLIMYFFPDIFEGAFPFAPFAIIGILLFALTINAIIMHCLSKAFGHSDLFTLGLIFLPIIFYPVLALDNSEYLGPKTSL